jgi:Ca-activated chloride channel homolog
VYFKQPELLILLILIPVMIMTAIFVVKKQRKQWSLFVANRLRKNLIRSSNLITRWLSLGSLLLSISLMVFAIARLQNESTKSIETPKGRNILIVLDLSRSMKTDDLKPSRLDQSKALIYELLETLPNDRIGIIGFASHPWLFAPLTTDHNAVRQIVEQVDFDSIPNGGSNISDAVELGIKTLKETSQGKNGLIILSDGEEHSPQLIDTIAAIKKSNTYTFTIGVGTENGGYIPDNTEDDKKFLDTKGDPVFSKLNTTALRDFASKTDGRFVTAESANDIPNMVRTAVIDLDTFELEGRKKIAADELFQWILIPAILLLIASIILGTQWRLPSSKTILTITFISFILTNFNYAKESQTTSQITSPSISLKKAAEAYQKNDFPNSRDYFSDSLLSNQPEIRAAAHQGLGNTLFQLGWENLTKKNLYPGEKNGLAEFDEQLKARIAEWMKEELEDPKAESEGLRNLKSILTDWADSVRHTQSALTINRSLKDAEQNRDLVLFYIKKIREAIEQQQQEMQQAGKGQGGQTPEMEGDEEGDDGDNKDGKNKDGGKNKQKKNNGQTPEPQKPDPKNEYGKDKRAGETPKEQALRKLNENADLQRGVTAPGNYEFRRSENDW